ncbi:MAG: hypothetical protein M1482_06120, partial [Chloroflexi bacterium]|nr:hypothetical protein [Chloroflexota bacterium]
MKHGILMHRPTDDVGVAVQDLEAGAGPVDEAHPDALLDVGDELLEPLYAPPQRRHRGPGVHGEVLSQRLSQSHAAVTSAFEGGGVSGKTAFKNSVCTSSESTGSE